MSLMACGECGRNISSQAIQCPKCGLPIQGSSPESKKGYVEPLILGCVLLGALVFSYYNYSMIRHQQMEQDELNKRQESQERFQQALFKRTLLGDVEVQPK